MVNLGFKDNLKAELAPAKDTESEFARRHGDKIKRDLDAAEKQRKNSQGETKAWRDEPEE